MKNIHDNYLLKYSVQSVFSKKKCSIYCVYVYVYVYYNIFDIYLYTNIIDYSII